MQGTINLLLRQRKLRCHKRNSGVNISRQFLWPDKQGLRANAERQQTIIAINNGPSVRFHRHTLAVLDGRPLSEEVSLDNRELDKTGQYHQQPHRQHSCSYSQSTHHLLLLWQYNNLLGARQGQTNPFASTLRQAAWCYDGFPLNLELLLSLFQRVDELTRGAALLGWKTSAEPSAILPLIVGEEAKAVATMDHLREAGFFIPAIRYPTVPRNEARLRVTLTANHTAENIEQLVNALG